MTAAINTPKAPTPPFSSAAGGLENVVEPAGFADELADVDLLLGLLVLAEDEIPVVALLLGSEDEYFLADEAVSVVVVE